LSSVNVEKKQHIGVVSSPAAVLSMAKGRKLRLLKLKRAIQPLGRGGVGVLLGCHTIADWPRRKKISILGGFVVDILAGCVIIATWSILFA